MKYFYILISILFTSSVLFADTNLSYHKEVNVSKLAEEIEEGTGYKLMKHYSTETVHGYIETSGKNIKIIIYDVELNGIEKAPFNNIVGDHIK